MSGSQQFCTFLLDRSLFGISVDQVRGVVQYQRITRVPLARSVVSGFINLRGQIVAALDLRRRLGLPERSPNALPVNVLVHSGDETISLLVDEVGDVIEVELNEAESTPATVEGFAREAVREVYKLDGRLLLALNVERVVDLSDLGPSAARTLSDQEPRSCRTARSRSQGEQE